MFSFSDETNAAAGTNEAPMVVVDAASLDDEIDWDVLIRNRITNKIEEISFAS